MTCRILFLTLASLLLPTVAWGSARGDEEPKWRVLRSMAVGTDEPYHPHIEPYLAIDPNDPARLVVGTMVATPNGLEVHALVSSDAGTTWQRTKLPGCGFDPWVSFGVDRTVYLSCLAGKEAWVFRSFDQGQTWQDPVAVPLGDGGEVDHASLTVPQMESTPSRGPWVVGMQPVEVEDQQLVVPFVSRSVDKAASFEAPSRLLWSSVWSNTLNAVVDSDGAVVLAFVDYFSGGSLLKHPRVWSTRVEDDQSFSPLSLVTVIEQGSTIPVMVAAGSSLLIAYDDVREGRSGVYLASSTDSGRTWRSSRAVVVSDSGTKAHFNAQVAAGPHGEVAVAWYEHRPTDEPRCYRVAAAVSEDHGATFGASLSLTPEPFCVDTPANLIGGEGRWNVARRWPFGGDYFGMAAWGPDRFALLWADSRSGPFRLHLAELALSGDGHDQ